MDRRKFQEELDQLKQGLLTMGAKVEKNIGDAITSLVRRDLDLARDVVKRDPEVDVAEIQIDERCLSILARFQPVARDLRFITTALKIVKDLERIGDMAGDISYRAQEVMSEPPLPILSEISKMAKAAQQMLTRALDAFVQQDVELARQVIKDDDQVDEFHRRIFDSLIAEMVENPKIVAQATHLLSVAKYLERVGDHSTNVAEMVVFLVEGDDIRHYDKIRDFRR